MLFRPGNIGHLGRLGLVAASQPSLVTQALAILAKYGSAANLYLPGVGAISGITAGNWLDSIGTTAATVDNTVGLVVSAGKAVGPNVATGPWINTHTTAFDTFSSSGSSGFTATTTGAKTDVRAGVPCAFQSGKTYQIEFTVSMTGATAGSVWFSTSALSGAQVINNPSGISSGVSYRVVGTATADRTHLMIIFNSSGAAAVTLTGLQVRELPGAHLTQSTAANRPVLRRGLLNLITQSTNLIHADWSTLTSAFTVTMEQGAGLGGAPACKIMGTGAVSVPIRTGFVATSTTVTYAILYKEGNSPVPAAGFLVRNVTTATNLTGTVSTVFLSDGWRLLTNTVTVGINVGNTLTIYLGYTGVVASGVFWYVGAVGLFNGALTAQQIIDSGGIPVTTTAPASSTNGPFAWQFDGSNDSFTSTLGTGNAGYFCTMANVSDTGSTRSIISNGAIGSTFPGVWLVRVGNDVHLFVGNGTTRNGIGATYQSVTNAIISAGWNASSFFVGVANTETSSSKTVDCTLATGLLVGAAPGASTPWLGTIGATIIMPTVLPTASERATLRQFIASLSGVTL